MRVLVTGGVGLVGSHTAEHYALKGNEVIVLDNLMRSKLFGYSKESVEYNWEYLAQYENVQLIKGDVRSKEDVLNAIGDGVDVVIHAAGQPGVPLSIKIPVEDFYINAFGTLNVLECVRQRCRDATFIYCSTNKVYGENVDGLSIVEKERRYDYYVVKGVPEGLPTDLTGHTPYGVSKLTGDLYTQEYGHIYGMKTGVFRMSCTTGIRQFGFEDQGWVSWFIIANLLEKPITIYGDGKQVRDLLYVTDLIDAFDRFIESDLRCEVFNIGGGPRNTVSLLEFLEIVEGITGKKTKVEFKDWRPSDQKVYITDLLKINTTLNWHPKVGVEESAKRIVKWVEANKEYFI